uniref:Predicted protein n=1 Tax=Hordeum vulgare subsp. vulgare TaxID=112509 RepID=F2CZJ6_HORVV|nr:predicted protein [Hordeum vulgare subsp. vulgare]
MATVKTATDSEQSDPTAGTNWYTRDTLAVVG